MDLERICRDLSCSVASPRTAAAARALLDSPDPNGTLARAYSYLVWQRTLLTALRHLEREGADLAEVSISEAAFRSTFPPRYRPIWDIDVAGPRSGANLVELYARHRRLLGDPVGELIHEGLDGFTLVSGRAYEARYPLYTGRVEFDTDLVVAGMEPAAAIASFLTGRGFILDSLRIRRLGPTADATFELRRRVAGHLVSVGLLVGGYHGYRRGIYEHSTHVAFRGEPTLAARPEDLLVMLAARVQRKRKFAFVNYNDAATILSIEGATLEWRTVAAGAVAAGVGSTLAVILEQAERVLGSPAVPAWVWGAIVPSAAPRLQRRLARAVAARDARPAPHGRRDDVAADRAWRLAVRIRRGEDRGEPALSTLALHGVQQRILAREIAAVRRAQRPAALGRVLPRLRTRCGALCEIAPHLAADRACLAAARPSRRRAPTPELLDAARLLRAPPGPHSCGRMTFSLVTADGT